MACITSLHGMTNMDAMQYLYTWREVEALSHFWDVTIEQVPKKRNEPVRIIVDNPTWYHLVAYTAGLSVIITIVAFGFLFFHQGGFSQWN